MGYTAQQLDSRHARDKVNAALRASDVWRNAIKGMGLNPDGPLHLTKPQQASLAQTLGVPTSDFHIDPAGNVNDFHGWKGLPTAAKIGVIAAAALGTAGAAGAFGGGSGAAAGAAGSTDVATGASAGIGTGATVAATAGSTLAGTLLKYGLQYGLPVAGGLISSKVAANANTDAARLENQYNNRALDAAIEEQTYQRRQGEDERAYQRRIDEYERSKYGEATGYDRSKYAEATSYDRSKYNEATNYGRKNYGNFVETLEPYRSAGANANQYASRLLGLPAPNDSGANYIDLARDARTPVNLPTNVNLPTGAPNLTFPSTGNAGNSQSNPDSGPGGVLGIGRHDVSTSQPVSSNPQFVTMQAPQGPNGEPGQIKQVPLDQQAHYESLGARRVA